MEQKKRNKTKTIIIVLAVLLAISLSALAGTVIYNKLAVNPNTTVTVPDNLITPDEEENKIESGATDESQNTSVAIKPTVNSSTQVKDNENQKKAISIALYNKQPEDNTAFSVGNMFPGDIETKYYRIQVSYNDKVTVHFKVDIRNGYEKLAEVMKVRVKLLTTGEIMYDALMKDMPKSVSHQLSSSTKTTDELYYEFTAYLDTSVGNEYQNIDLIADFSWWVGEKENLGSAPSTNDDMNILMWAMIALISCVICIFGIINLKKKEDEENA